MTSIQGPENALEEHNNEKSGGINGAPQFREDDAKDDPAVKESQHFEFSINK